MITQQTTHLKLCQFSSVTQSCPILSDPMDCSLPGSSVHGIFQARVLEWGAIAFSKVEIGVWNSQEAGKAKHLFFLYIP